MKFIGQSTAMAGRGARRPAQCRLGWRLNQKEKRQWKSKMNVYALWLFSSSLNRGRGSVISVRCSSPPWLPHSSSPTSAGPITTNLPSEYIAAPRRTEQYPVKLRQHISSNTRSSVIRVRGKVTAAIGSVIEKIALSGD